jgi:hypothetical protein
MTEQPPGADRHPEQPSAADRHHPPGAGRHPDPMAADKRVLIIGLVVMVALVGIGVASAAIFAGSACRDIGAQQITVPNASSELDDVVGGRDGIDAQAAETLRTLVDDLSGHLGPLTGVAHVSGATSLTRLGGGVAATGPVTVALDAAGASVVGTAGFDDPAIVVGSGERVYSLALMNQLTGQVDALLPFDGALDPGTCVDTAVVGDPFAFYLDAGDGQLLLLRVEEDADDPELELRDATVGRRWTASVDVPVAPPGILAERVSAALGDEVIVAARRVIPGEDAPAAIGVGRSDGDRRWELDAETVLEIFGDDEPLWIEVTDVGVAPDSDRDHAALLAIDVEAGRVIGRIDPGGSRAAILASYLDVHGVVVAWRDGQEVVLQRFDADGAEVGSAERRAGDLAETEDGLAITENAVLAVADDGIVEVARTEGAARLRDVLRVGDATSLLVDLGEGQRVAVTFGAG